MDSGHSSLNVDSVGGTLYLLLLATPVEHREEEGDDGGAEPEPAYVGEIVFGDGLAYLVHHLDRVVVKKEAGDYVLQAGGGVGGHSYDAEGGSGGFSRNEVNGHQTAKETDQNTDGDSEQNH